MSQVLTDEQRWLLAGVGGWAIADCFVTPTSGISSLMSSMQGSSTGRQTSDFPEWLSQGYACGNGRIVSPWMWRPGSDTAPHALVTTAQLARYAATIPAGLRDRLADALGAHRRENVAWSTTCFCGEPEWHADDPIYRDRWHPTAEQRQAHNECFHANLAAIDALVFEVCDLTAPQLALF